MNVRFLKQQTTKMLKRLEKDCQEIIDNYEKQIKNAEKEIRISEDDIDRINDVLCDRETKEYKDAGVL